MLLEPACCRIGCKFAAVLVIVIAVHPARVTHEIALFAPEVERSRFRAGTIKVAMGQDATVAAGAAVIVVGEKHLAAVAHNAVAVPIARVGALHRARRVTARRGASFDVVHHNARRVACPAIVHVRAQVGLASIGRVSVAVAKARVAHASGVGAAL